MAHLESGNIQQTIPAPSFCDSLSTFSALLHACFFVVFMALAFSASCKSVKLLSASFLPDSPVSSAGKINKILWSGRPSPSRAFIMLISRLTCRRQDQVDYGLSKLLAALAIAISFYVRGIKNAKVIISNGNVCSAVFAAECRLKWWACGCVVGALPQKKGSYLIAANRTTNIPKIAAMRHHCTVLKDSTSWHRNEIRTMQINIAYLTAQSYMPICGYKMAEWYPLFHRTCLKDDLHWELNSIPKNN